MTLSRFPFSFLFPVGAFAVTAGATPLRVANGAGHVVQRETAQ